MAIPAGLLATFALLPFAAFAQSTLVVPFVGCPSDGQVGPRPAPTTPPHEVRVALKIAPQLSYYSTRDARAGVLAPRGWTCFGVYGSSGEYLYITPEPLDSKRSFPVSGPVVAFDYVFGGTSGRYRVAELISRLFPAYKALLPKWMQASMLLGNFRVTPYSKDAIIFQSARAARYTTAPNAVGVGTGGVIKPNADPVDGIAILLGEALEEEIPDVLQVNLRLPRDLNVLKPHILRQAEIDASGLAER